MKVGIVPCFALSVLTSPCCANCRWAVQVGWDSALCGDLSRSGLQSDTLVWECMCGFGAIIN